MKDVLLRDVGVVLLAVHVLWVGRDGWAAAGDGSAAADGEEQAA